jgi:hypothetical protein
MKTRTFPVKEMLMRLPAANKVIGQGLKERLGGVEQEPLKPEMEDLLRELDKATRERRRRCTPRYQL